MLSRIAILYGTRLVIPVTGIPYDFPTIVYPYLALLLQSLPKVGARLYAGVWWIGAGLNPLRGKSHVSLLHSRHSDPQQGECDWARAWCGVQTATSYSSPVALVALLHKFRYDATSRATPGAPCTVQSLYYNVHTKNNFAFNKRASIHKQPIRCNFRTNPSTQPKDFAFSIFSCVFMDPTSAINVPIC